MKLDIITYAYRGLVSTILFLIGKKKKIREVFAWDEEDRSVNLDMANLTSGSANSEEFVDANAVTQAKLEEHLQVEKKKFRYVATDLKGKKIKGTFDAYNIDQAKKFLTDEGLNIITINLRNKLDVDLTIGNPLSVAELAFALTQLSTYIKAGITLIDSVRILAKQAEKPAKKKIYQLVIYDLLSGDSFSNALAKQPKVFPKLLVNMVKSAELTGDLPNILDDMANYYESIDKSRKEVKSAMTYPTVVAILAVVVVTFVFVWVVPQYEQMFKSFHQDLPSITKMTIAVSNFINTNLTDILIVIILILSLYLYLFKNVRSFRLIMQSFYLKLPVIKNLIMYKEISMFSRTFASLINHGVYISASMDVLLKVSENEVYRRIIKRTVDNLNAGGKISETFKDNPVIPVVAYEMIVTGESTGNLGEMLEKVSDYYDGLNKNAAQAIKSLIEPALIIFLAAIVGVIILSVILPMFSMYNSLSS